MSGPLLIASLVSIVTMIVGYVAMQMLTASAIRYREQFTQTARIDLADLFLFIEPERLFLFVCLLAGSTFLLLLVIANSAVVALIGAVAIGMSPPLLFRILKKRRIAQLIEQLPDTLVSIANAMKSGSNLMQAIENTITEVKGPIAQEFDLFLREIRVGVDLSEAMDNMAARVKSPELDLVVAGMKISREIGGDLADVLDRLANTLRRKLEMEGKIKALTSQGKLQGLVMSGLPVFLALVLYHMEPAHMSRLFTEPYGWGVTALIVVMEFIGYYFIRKIVNIDV